MAKKTIKKSPPEMPEAILKKIASRAGEIAKPHNLAIHEVTFGPTSFCLTLTVAIKSLDEEIKSIAISDCELVSRPLSKELDEILADFSDNYILEVTSIGISEDETYSLEDHPGADERGIHE